MKQLMTGARTVVRECLNIKPLEKVLVLTDRKMLKIGKVLYDASSEINLETILMVMEPTGRDGAEPPGIVAQAMKNSDVVIAPTYYSLSHTKARREACANGARIASMPRVQEFSFTKGGLTADYQEVEKLGRLMRTAVEQCNMINVTSKNGTNVNMSVEGRKWHDATGVLHEAGKWDNLPSGEVCTAPIEGTTNGTIVFDYFSDYGNRVKLVVEDGIVKNVENSPRLVKLFEQLGEKARIIAEIGIGCNPKAKIINNILEDEKVMGTVHIALGNNVEGGGSNYTPFHQDGIIVRPTLKADEKILIDNGKWKI
jgi:leucyl aminopeptidase (aminopeptidase T)